MNYVPLDKDYVIRDETHPNTEDVSGEVTEPVRKDTPQEQIDEYIKAAREAAASLGVESLRTEDVYNIYWSAPTQELRDKKAVRTQ